MQFSTAPDRVEAAERKCSKCGGTGRMACNLRLPYFTCRKCVAEHEEEGAALPCDDDERIPCDECGRG